MNPIDTLVGKNLRERRVLAGMSQNGLGNAVGISFQQIQKYERGANRISASRLVELAGAVHCEVSDMFAGLDKTLDTTEQRTLIAIRREHKIIDSYNHLPETIQSALANLVTAMSLEIEQRSKL